MRPQSTDDSQIYETFSQETGQFKSFTISNDKISIIPLLDSPKTEHVNKWLRDGDFFITNNIIIIGIMFIR